MAIDLQKLKEKYTQLTQKTTQNTDYSNLFLKIEEGANFNRILPNKKEGYQFYANTAIHAVKDAEGKFRYVHCRKVHNEVCPLCEAYFQIWNQHKAKCSLKNHANCIVPFGKGVSSIKAKPRYYMNVVNRKDDTVKVLSAPEQLFTIIMANILGDDAKGLEALGDITDLNEGYDFNIIGTKQDAFLVYSESRFKTKPSKAGISDKKIAEYLDQRHDLEALVKVEEYSEVKEIADFILSNSMNDVVHNKPTESTTVSEEDYKAQLEKQKG